MPIDNIIQVQLEKFGIPLINGVRSKIKDYETYYNYQKAIRQEFQNEIPLDVEFTLFNDAIGTLQDNASL